MRRQRSGPVEREAAPLIREVMDDLRRVFQVINDHSKRAKRTTGLTGPQLWALKVLAEFAPLRVTDLAARMYLHPSTVVGILHRLEVRGLVERSRSRSDRRVVLVVLTPAARSLVLRVPAVAQSALLAGLEALSLRELRAVSRGLRLQVRILNAQEITPRLLLSPEINAPEGAGNVNPSGSGPRSSPAPSAAARRGRRPSTRGSAGGPP